MTQSRTIKFAQSLAIAAMLAVTTLPAQAQGHHSRNDNNDATGAIVGGVLGAVIGGTADRRGSKADGIIVGAAVGGSLGYLLGSRSDKRDRQLRQRYSNQRGEYYRHNGIGYRRFKDRDHGYVTVRILDNDPYYYHDGRVKNRGNRRSNRNNRRY